MAFEFKKRPNDELLERFSSKIENFLSAHNLKFEIELSDFALPMDSYINGEHTGRIYFWIKGCRVEMPGTNKKIKVNLLEQGIDDDITDAHIWNEAAYIQDQLYKELNKNPGNPKADNPDPYWKLWDLYPDKK